jgi:hypothetical protein
VMMGTTVYVFRSRECMNLAYTSCLTELGRYERLTESAHAVQGFGNDLADTPTSRWSGSRTTIGGCEMPSSEE